VYVCMWVCVAGWLGGGALGSLSLFSCRAVTGSHCAPVPLAASSWGWMRERGKAWLHVNDNRFRGAQSARAVARSQAWRHFILLVAKFSPLSLILSAAAKCTHQCGRSSTSGLYSRKTLWTCIRVGCGRHGFTWYTWSWMPNWMWCNYVESSLLCQSFLLPASFRCFLRVSVKTIMCFMATKFVFL